MTKSLIDSTVVVLAMLWTASLGYAQPSGPTTFYPKDFVNGPAQHKESSQGTNQITRPSPQAAQRIKPPQQFAITPSTNNISELEQKKRPRTAPSGFVYATSIDKEHFTQVLDKVLALQRQGKIRINIILHYGNYENISERQEATLLQHGIHIIELRELPNDLPVSQSPAWVIFNPDAATADSDTPLAYLVQGYFNIEQFFDQFGVFTLPAGMGDDHSSDHTSGKLAGF